MPAKGLAKRRRSRWHLAPWFSGQPDLSRLVFATFQVGLSVIPRPKKLGKVPYPACLPAGIKSSHVLQHPNGSPSITQTSLFSLSTSSSRFLFFLPPIAGAENPPLSRAPNLNFSYPLFLYRRKELSAAAERNRSVARFALGVRFSTQCLRANTLYEVGEESRKRRDLGPGIQRVWIYYFHNGGK